MGARLNVLALRFSALALFVGTIKAPAPLFIVQRGGPRSVSCAGDLDGDARADIALGLSNRALVISSSDGRVLWERAGEQNEAFGASVGGFLDLDADGLRDVLVGAPGIVGIDGFDGSGSVHVLSGKDGRTIRHWTGKEPRERFGHEVRNAGDVDGDGVDDAIVGVPDRGAGQGAAEVFSGRDGSRLHSFAGERPGIRFGTSVSGAGDVDADGHADLVVGAPGAVTGTARIYSGRTGELLRELLPFECPKPGRCGFGRSVSDAGDLDKDGHADVLVGAESAGKHSQGRAWVFSGADGSMLSQLGMNGLRSSFGSSVTSLPDVDGDGETDLAISDPDNSMFSAEDPLADWDDRMPRGQAPGGVFVLSGRDGKLIWATAGDAGFDRLGTCIERSEDIDGDSIPDVLAKGARYARVLSGKDGSVLLDFRWPVELPTAELGKPDGD